MEQIARYTYRIRPGAQATAYLEMEWHRCRHVWNESVHMAKTGQKVGFTALGKTLTESRSRNGWLRDGSQNAQQMTLRTFAQATSHSFKVKGRGKPAYTTMTCSRCGAIAKSRLSLSERTFRCECGYQADRDRNAAQTILALADLNQASVDGVRRTTEAYVLVGAT